MLAPGSATSPVGGLAYRARHEHSGTVSTRSSRVRHGRAHPGSGQSGARAPLAVAVARVGLHDLPAALPLPRARPAPPAPEPCGGARNLVHAVLEQLFDLPAADRTHAQASAKLASTWGRLLDDEPVLGELFATALAGEPTGTDPIPDAVLDETPDAVTPDAAAPEHSPGAGVEAFLVEAEDLLSRYFTLEDPSRLEPAEREIRVETTLDSGLQLRGIIDRLDIAPTGEIRVVDYKTGRAPSEVFEAKALFQMKFYALVVWRVRGVMPTLLQLIYLGGTGELLRYAPEERDLLATERKLTALWAAIERAYVSGDWRPSPSKLCAWCDYQAICPAFGGTPPPLPSGTPSAVPTIEDEPEG